MCQCANMSISSFMRSQLAHLHIKKLLIMNLTDTPNANRLHIALFGRRNSGKSSLINALTGQDTALVSNTPGTTNTLYPKLWKFKVLVRVCL